MEETCVVTWMLIREREDISELECLMVSGIIRLNDYRILIGRGESRGVGQVDWFIRLHGEVRDRSETSLVCR